MRKLFLINLLFLSGIAFGQSVKDYDYEEYRKRLAADSSKGLYNIKDSLLYENADDAYRLSNQRQNRQEFIRFYIINKRREIESDIEENNRIAGLKKKYGAAVTKKLLNGEVWIGMTDKMVIDEFGYADVKRAITASGTTETWTYLPSSHCIGNGCPVLNYYMVFKNHKLVAIGDL